MNMSAIFDQTRLDHPIVSFCIPVYNNAQAAEKIVKELLSCDDSRFEVVVSDDDSRENVGELMSRIHDSRLRYSRNAKNIGAHRNWQHVLELGRGEWLYLIMARDRMHGENIPHLIELLRNARRNNIVFLKDGYSYLYGRKKNGCVYSGIEAMTEFVMITHPTGDIYSREALMSVQERDRYFTTSDMYPEARLKFAMLLRGKGGYITSGIHIYGEKNSRLINFVETKSGVEHKENIFDTYYAPRRSTIQIFELMDMADREFPEAFSKNEADIFFGAKFRELLRLVTLTWYKKCASYSWATHYGHATRYVSSFEMADNVIAAYRSTKAHLKEQCLFTVSRRRIMLTACAKTLAKCFLYYPVRRVAKKILEASGMLEILKRIKDELRRPRI
ncbi:MAG: glycosyltransferase [Synergistaceae bacterium]|nr:glycosyltransferase [Synergistaceae bacterium]